MASAGGGTEDLVEKGEKRLSNSSRLALIQTTHMIEHVAKMYQYYVYSITVGPKGILGFIAAMA